MAIILHIDTSEKHLYLAISKNGIMLSEYLNDTANNHVALINIEVENLLQKNNISLRDLQAVSVLNGPGSYTGLRVGLSMAKAFCFSLQIPLLLCNKLQLMAMCASALSCIPVIKAMKDEYFVAQYLNKEISLEPCLIKLDNIKTIDFSLNTAILLDETLKTELNINSFEIINQTAIYKAFINLSYSQLIESQYVDITNAVPFYIKNTYIAPKL